MYNTIFLAAVTAIYMFPSLINGGPFFYYDSAAYIEIVAKAVAKLWPTPPEAYPDPSSASSGAPFGAVQNDGVIYSVRSIYYGVLAYTGWITTIYLPIAVQCLALAWLTAAQAQRLLGAGWRRCTLLIAVALTLGSSAGAFAGLLMPDIWSGLAVLALALLWSPGGPLTRGAQAVLLAILTFAALSHKSHIALIGVLLTACLVLRPFLATPLRPRLAALAVPALALGIGIAGQLAFTMAVEAAYGHPPISRPFITAHLVDMGPGTAFVQETCPTPAYAICAFADRLPTDWIAFLFSRFDTDGVFATADAATQRALVNEQMSFVLGTLAARPLATVGGLALDGIRQLWILTIADVPMTRQSQTFLEANFPTDLTALIQTTLIYNHPSWVIGMTYLIEITSLCSALALAVWVFGRVRSAVRPSLYRLEALVLVCVSGVMANALICGILASPYGRFQARIIWLLPMLVLYILLTRNLRPQRS